MNGRSAGKLARGPLLANGMKPVLYLIGLVLLLAGIYRIEARGKYRGPHWAIKDHTTG